MTTAVNRDTILDSGLRAMRNKSEGKNWSFISVCVVALALFSIAVIAEQPSAEGKSAAEKKEAVENRTAEPSTVKPVQKKVEPAGRFNPSEKLRADDAVSFPVDI